MSRWARTLASLLVALSMVACASGRQPDSGLARAPDETLPRRAWLAAKSGAVVLAVHGVNDYARAFVLFGHAASRQGVSVHAYDQPTFGQNPDSGARFDLCRLRQALLAEYARVRALYDHAIPVYVLGESMGAAVVLTTFAEGKATGACAPLPADLVAPAGFVFVAPATWGGDQLNPLFRAAAKALAAVAPGLMLSGRDLPIHPTDNINLLRQLSLDPYMIKQMRADAVVSLIDTVDAGVAHAPLLRGRVLWLTGRRDTIIPPETQSAIRARLTAQDCTAILYEDGYHMLLRDRQRAEVTADVLAWLAGDPLPSAKAQPCRSPASS